MGKLGRIACIATPGLLTVAALVCLLVVFLAGQFKGDANSTGLYFVRVNTESFKNQIFTGIKALPGTTVNNNFLNLLNDAVKNDKLHDFYNVYIWNYCSGEKDGKVAFCSPRTTAYYFNPIEVWGLNGTDAAQYIPKGVNDGLKVYSKVSKWMFTAYSVAFWATVINFVTGFFAICSRWGSLVTTIVSCVATVFTILAALTSTILFSTLAGAFNTALKPYGIHITIGTRMLSLDWIAVAFSLGSTLFWTISICCCSGKSNSPAYKGNRSSLRGNAEKGLPGGAAAAAGSGSSKGFNLPAMPWANRGYQPLEPNRGQQPFGAQQTGVELGYLPPQSQGGPHKGRETAYEPFRQH